MTPLKGKSTEKSNVPGGVVWKLVKRIYEYMYLGFWTLTAFV